MKLSLDIAQNLLDTINTESGVLTSVTTGDCYGCIGKTWKQKHSCHNENILDPQEQKKCVTGNKGDDVFFDICGFLHHEYIPEEQKVRTTWVLWTMEKIYHLQHENAPAHSSHLVQNVLAKHIEFNNIANKAVFGRRRIGMLRSKETILKSKQNIRVVS